MRQAVHSQNGITWSVFCKPQRRKNVITWPEFFNCGLKPTVPEASRKKALVHGRLRWIVSLFTSFKCALKGYSATTELRRKELQSPTKVLARLHTFPVSVNAIYQVTPSPQFNAVYRDEDCHCSFPTLSGGWGRGFLIPVLPLVIVSKIAYQRMFQLSDPGVPRTFVEDCRWPQT